MSVLLLPFADYQRIYQTIYSVLKSSGIARHRACLTFATAGMLVLRNHYGLNAKLSAGSMALMADEESALILFYGRQEHGEWICNTEGFHAWVECDGWLIDFMAPIMGQAFNEDGHSFEVPRRMLQKPLAERKPYIQAIQHEGEFFCLHDTAVADSLLDRQTQKFFDILDVCQQWYRRPPSNMPAMARRFGSPFGPKQEVVLDAPSIDGVW
ncbi:DUF2026 domain-containing protein [Comamonas humi]